MNIAELQRQHDQAVTHATAQRNRFTATAASEQRPLGPGEISAINSAVHEANAIAGRLARARQDEGMTAEMERLSGDIYGDGPRGARRGGNSFGDQFVSDAGYQEWIKRGGHRAAGSWTSPGVNLGGDGEIPVLRATLLTESAGSAGATVLPHNLPGVQELPTRRLSVSELFPRDRTDSNAIQYMREVTFTNAAAAVAEGGVKPETTLVFDTPSSPTQKIAHWVPATEELLEDFAGMRAYIDRRLLHGLDLVLDDAIINGSGVSPILKGILARAVAAPIARVAQSNADVIAAQIAAIEAATLLPVDGIVMHPTNFLAVQLLKEASGAYISGSGPVGPPQPPMLWGRRVAISPVIAVNSALVGCFGAASTLFFRSGPRVEVSNSHASFFVENKVAIRAELRANLVIYREAAFGLVTNLTA